MTLSVFQGTGKTEKHVFFYQATIVVNDRHNNLKDMGADTN